MLWWLSEDAVIAQGNSGRKDHHGKELQFFDVLVDSKIMVESLQSVSAGALKGLGNNVTPARVHDLTVETGGSGVPVAMNTIVAIVVNIISDFIYDAIKDKGDGPVKVSERLVEIIEQGGLFPPKPPK